MTPDRMCAHCLGPLLGYATIGAVLLCHPDDGMDCYRLVLYGHGIDCPSCTHRRATGVDGCPIFPDCDPWRGTPGLPCPFTSGPCALNQPGSGPGRVAPAGGRGAGEHDPGRDTPGGGHG